MGSSTEVVVRGIPFHRTFFVLAVEIMAAAIRVNTEIKGIKIFEKEQKNSLYADDTRLYLAAQERSLGLALITLQEFKQILGLKINIEKTKIINIGVWGDSRSIFHKEKNLIWTTEFTSLGITFNTVNINRITEINLDIKMNEICKLIKVWTPRLLTPLLISYCLSHLQNVRN